MKKKAIAIIVLSLTLLFTGCNMDVNIKDSAGENKGKVVVEIPTETPTEEPTTEVTMTPAKNEFFNEQNNFYDANQVTIRPRHMYWEGDKLVAECFVINGLDKTVHSINVKKLKFSNSEGVIADAAFGVMENAQIAPYSHLIWTFYFDSSAIQMMNGDLNSLHYESSVNYRY